jgi:tRNA-(ms[2]io[6]A)-hydroxylase
MLKLRYDTPVEWVQVVENNMDEFLKDHAHSERKVAAAALTLVAHQPQRRELVNALVDLAREELSHFREVLNRLQDRGQWLTKDEPDAYMTALHKMIRRGDTDHYFLDRLLVFGLVEARGCERFYMLGKYLPEGAWKDFYAGLAKAEARHHGIFLRLARSYFSEEEVEARVGELLDSEAKLVESLPLRAALH